MVVRGRMTCSFFRPSAVVAQRSTWGRFRTGMGILQRLLTGELAFVHLRHHCIRQTRWPPSAVSLVDGRAGVEYSAGDCLLAYRKIICGKSVIGTDWSCTWESHAWCTYSTSLPSSRVRRIRTPLRTHDERALRR